MPKRRKHRGHWCWMCGRTRPNEQFSGRGHAQHLCRECARLPRQERDRAQAMNDLEGFMSQRHISEKNIARLDALTRSPDADVAYYAGLVLQVARLRPSRRKRIGFLIHHHRELYEKLVACGLAHDAIYDDFDEEGWFAAELEYPSEEEPEDPDFNLDAAVAEWDELRADCDPELEALDSELDAAVAEWSQARLQAGDMEETSSGCP